MLQIPMKETTFAMLKPDAIKRGLQVDLISRITGVTNADLLQTYIGLATKELIDKHYEEVFESLEESGRGYLVDSLRDYMTSGPVMPMLWSGEDVVSKLRIYAGNNFDPVKNEIGTIRRDYGIDDNKVATLENRTVENLIHTSDSLESAAKESELWFPEVISLIRINKDQKLWKPHLPLSTLPYLD